MRGRQQSVSRLLALAVLALLAAPIAAFAQATPAAAPPTNGGSMTPGLTVAASGLVNPRGVAWSPDGTMFVALAGTGGDRPSAGDTPQEQADGVYDGGDTGSIVRIDNGCGVPVATGLPSTHGRANGRDQGPAGLAFLDGDLYMTNDGAGAPHGNPDHPNGVYVIGANGGWAVVADFNVFVPAYPTANVPGDYDPGGEPWDLITLDDALIVSESNSGQLLRVDPDGSIVRLVDLSDGHPVPTGLATDGNGNLYVGTLTTTPYLDGAAKVIKHSANGRTSTVWTGLTMLTDVEASPDGTLYALEMATGNTMTPPFIQPNTGKIVRQTGPDSAEDVVTGLDRPAKLATGPDGALYISLPALHDPGTAGGILRVDPAAPLPIVYDPALLEQTDCATIGAAAPVSTRGTSATTTPASVGGSAITGEAGETGDAQPFTEDQTILPGEPRPDATESAGAGSAAETVSIDNFAFMPPTISIPAGGSVTWVNNDTVPHTATANDGAFNSGNLNPGQHFSHTFAEAGSFPYTCQYHPGMTGEIDVR